MSDTEFESGRSRRLVAVLVAAFTMLGTAGCAGTRLPSLQPSPVQYERQQAELFYPFAEEGTGPAVGVQPREYSVQRSEATRLQRSNQFFIP